MRFLRFLPVFLLILSTAIADETAPVLGYAVMRRDRAIPEKGEHKFPMPPKGTILYSPKASATGYLVVWDDTEGEPRMAVLPFRDQYGRATAKAWLYDAGMETNTVEVRIPMPLRLGYIPLMRGRKYSIIASDADSYTLRYDFHGLARTITIDSDEAVVELPPPPERDPRKLREKEIEKLLERAKAEEKELQERLAKSKENARRVGMLLKQIGKAGTEKKRLLAEIAKSEASYNKLLGYEPVTAETAEAIAAELAKISKRHGELAAKLEVGGIEADALKVLYTLLIRIDADLEQLKTDVTAKLAEIQGLVSHYEDKEAKEEREKVREFLRQAREQLSGYQVQVKHLETQREMLTNLYEQLAAAEAALAEEVGKVQEVSDAITALGEGKGQDVAAVRPAPPKPPKEPEPPKPPKPPVGPVKPVEPPVEPPAEPPVEPPPVEPPVKPPVKPPVEPPPVEPPVKPVDPAPKVTTRTIDPLDTAAGWFVENWGDTAKIAIDIEDRLQVDFTVGAKGKVAISKHFPEGLKLKATDTVVIDVENRIKEAVQIAIALYLGAQWKYYESKPFFVRPGRYEVYFNMAARTFKSESTNWEYKDALGGNIRTGKISLLVFSQKPGQVFFDKLRVESPAK